MPLGVEVRQEGTIAVLKLEGKITLGEASQSIRSHVEKLIADGCSQIVFDLRGVPFIDSAGLGALTLSYTKAKAAGGSLKLCNVQTRVKDALEMTRLTKLFTLYGSDREAISSFATEQPLQNAQPEP